MQKVVVFTRPMASANYLVASLASRVSRVYVEAFDTTPPSVPSLRNRLRNKWERIRTSEPPREPAIFGPIRPVAPELIRPISRGAFATCLDELRAESPDLIILLGSSLVPDALVACARVACLNIHLGWAPEYRGLFTTEWAILRDELDRVGVTVHRVVSRVDGGTIVERARPKLAADDDAVSIDLRLQKLGIELVAQAVAKLERGEALPSIPQEGPGRLFLRREMTEELRDEVRRRVSAGTIRRYVLGK